MTSTKARQLLAQIRRSLMNEAEDAWVRLRYSHPTAV